MKEILKRVSKITGIPETDILKKTRKREIIEIRQLFQYVCYKKGFKKYQITKFCNFNNSTIIHNIKVFEDLLTIDKDLRSLYNKVMTNDKVYLSGQISNIPKKEAERNFNKAEKHFTNLNYTVVNPMKIGDYQKTWEQNMAIDIIELLNCDCIHMLPGWEKSTGATLENEIAKIKGLKFV